MVHSTPSNAATTTGGSGFRHPQSVAAAASAANAQTALLDLLRQYPALHSNLPQPQLWPLLLNLQHQIAQQSASANAVHDNSLSNADLSSLLSGSSGAATSTPIASSSDAASSAAALSFLVGSGSSAFSTTSGSVSSLAGGPPSPSATPLSVINAAKVRRRARPSGSAAKTAPVWKYFEQRPANEQAATCLNAACRKIIKATNSSTTGMIRHLRSCHQEEFAELEKEKQKKLVQATIKACNGEDIRQQFADIISQSALGVTATSVSSASNNSHLGAHQQSSSSSAASAISPNSIASNDQTASSGSSIAAALSAVGALAEQQQKTSPHHSIDALLLPTAVAKAAAAAAAGAGGDNEEEEDDEEMEGVDVDLPLVGHPSTVFTTPSKYMAKLQRELHNGEAAAKKTTAAAAAEAAAAVVAAAARAHNAAVNTDEDEDVENQHHHHHHHHEQHDEDEDESDDYELDELSTKRAKLAHNEAIKPRAARIRKLGAEQFDKIEQGIALWLLLDGRSPEELQQQGFRLLLRLLAPAYALPSAHDFNTRIIPTLKRQCGIKNDAELATLRQQLAENNRFSHAAANGSTWPISPSSTCESSYEADAHSEAVAATTIVDTTAAAARSTLVDIKPSRSTLAVSSSPPPSLAATSTPLASKRLAHIKVESGVTSPHHTAATDDSGQFSMSTTTIELTPERRTTA